jgi:anti-sigma regulatory factor (Ser/Thr protein kinase)
MKTKEEILNKIESEQNRIEELEHLISEAELSIKMHQKELNNKNICINILTWCTKDIKDEKLNLEPKQTKYYKD